MSVDERLVCQHNRPPSSRSHMIRLARGQECAESIIRPHFSVRERFCGESSPPRNQSWAYEIPFLPKSHRPLSRYFRRGIAWLNIQGERPRGEGFRPISRVDSRRPPTKNQRIGPHEESSCGSAFRAIFLHSSDRQLAALRLSLLGRYHGKLPHTRGIYGRSMHPARRVAGRR